MKIRSGFVSNSSSSSFCIMGLVVDREVYNKVEDVNWGKDCKTDLQTKCGISEYYDQYLIGYSVGKMKDDETMLQFKQRVVEEMKKIGLDYKVEDLEWCVDGGRDG